MAPPLPMKIEVQFEPRPDGGLRAYCPGVPGFVLSHADPEAVKNDVGPVLEVMLSAMMGVPVTVRPMVDVADIVHRSGEAPSASFAHRDYVGTPLGA
jgi:hypothetical protein